ncbi:MAG TPA: flippase-like domain-containing protein [Candidatus Bathyarchaeia archaeon]
MSKRPEIKKWVSLLAILGFAIFVIYLLFFTDLVEVAVIISGVNVPIYFLVFVCILCVVVFNTLAWKATLDNVSVKTTFKRVFNLVWVGAFLDCIIPGNWSGDIFVTYLLGRDEGVDVIKVAASVIIKDILELLVILSSLIMGMILLVVNYSIDAFILTAIGITMIFLALPLVLIVYLSTNVSVTKRILQFLARMVARFKHKKPSHAFEQKIATQITNFHDVIMIIKKKPKSMIKPIIFQTMAWVFNIVALYLVFVSLRQIVGLDKVIITNTIVGNVSHQGVALVGFSQIISSSLYQILGINISMAQASSLLSSFANFWFRFIISFVFFETYGLETIAEKILTKAFKEKKKLDKKDFKEQTDSDKRDFEEKADSDKKDFEKLSDNKERDYKEQKDSDKKDFEEKADSDKKDYKEQKDSDKKDFKEKMDKDEKDFKDKKDSQK